MSYKFMLVQLAKYMTFVGFPFVNSGTHAFASAPNLQEISFTDGSGVRRILVKLFLFLFFYLFIAMPQEKEREVEKTAYF